MTELRDCSLVERLLEKEETLYIDIFFPFNKRNVNKSTDQARETSRI